MKRQRQTELPRFIVGALATAGASAASGATVQITFANNVLSTLTGTTNFTPDLTGDSTPDVYHTFQGLGLSSRSVFLWERLGPYGSGGGNTFGGAWFRYTTIEGANVQVGGAIVQTGNNSAWNAVPGGKADRGLYPITFTDPGINGGAPTSGWLELMVASIPGVEASVEIHRLIFDDASTTAPAGVIYTDPAFPEFVSAVPEPGSNLALLALGAGGLTLRRRLKRAA